ncbi:MAG: response regulator [Candidatus Methylomirabilales bacterium]
MGRGQRILMVDNDPVILEAVGDMLAAKEHQVTKARDGLEALEQFRKSSFDLAILDIVVPKIDGHDLCRLIRQDERGRLLPIIAFTALAPHDVAKLPGLSADAYVAKGPLTVVIPNILDAIKSVMTSRRGHQGQRIFGYEGFRPRRIVSEMFDLKRHYQRLVHAVAEVVIELDAQAKILSANPMALRLIGRSEAEVTGLAFSDLLTPRDQADFQGTLAQLSEDPLGGAAMKDLTIAGTRRRLRCQPVLDNGEIAGFLVTAGS